MHTWATSLRSVSSVGEKWNARYLDSPADWWIDRWIYRLQIVRNEAIDESDIHGGQRYRRKPSTRGPTSLSWRDQTKPVDRTEVNHEQPCVSPSLFFHLFLIPLFLWIRVYQYVCPIYFQVASFQSCSNVLINDDNARGYLSSVTSLLLFVLFVDGIMEN